MSDVFFPSGEGCANWRNAGLCSGHGRCVSVFNALSNATTSQCQCDQYWTGRGHFINQNHYDCSLHIPTAIAFHVLMCFFMSVNFFATVGKVTEFVTSGVLAKKADTVFGVLVKIASESYPFRTLFVSILWSLLGIVICCFQFTGVYIGQNLASSFIFGVFMLCYWITGLYGTRIYVRLHLAIMKFSGEEKALKRSLKRFGLNPMLVITPLFFTQSVPIFLLGFFPDSGSLQHILTFCFFFSMLYALPLGMGTCAYYCSKFAKVLRPGEEQNFFQKEKRNKLSQALTNYAKQIIIALFYTQVIYYLATFWPYFRTRMTYVLPLMFCSTAMVYRKGALVYDSNGSVADKQLETFQRIIGDEVAFNLFLKFLETEHSSENLLFWKQVEDFRAIYSRGFSLVSISSPADPSIRSTASSIAADPPVSQRNSEDLELLPPLTSTPMNSTPRASRKFFSSPPPPVDAAKQIYANFIENEIINIPYECRAEIIEWYAEVISHEEILVKKNSELSVLLNVYKTAQFEIWQLMRNDSLPRFQNSAEYKQIQDRWQASAYIREMVGADVHSNSSVGSNTRSPTKEEKGDPDKSVRAAET